MKVLTGENKRENHLNSAPTSSFSSRFDQAWHLILSQYFAKKRENQRKTFVSENISPTNMEIEICCSIYRFHETHV